MGATPASNMPTMAKQQTPKTMSSRLMTMKFMQRGAAAAAAAAGTPGASSPATPTSDDGSAKRRKTFHTPSATSSPATPLFDQQAIRAAVEEEERKKQAAIEKRAAELGDSHWVLEGVASLPPRVSRPLLNVVEVGFAQIDYGNPSGNDDDSDPFDLGGVPCRPQFQRFNMKKSKASSAVKKENGNSSSSDSDSESHSDAGESSEDEDSAEAARAELNRGRQSTIGGAERRRPRSSVSGRREEERRKAQQLASKRRKKDIKLNQLTSISSAGSQAFQRPSGTLSCHGCGKPGHKVADCPKRKR
ncbi:hypothetical protein C7999DRAFT_37093 [Corynascus novoguineensis]|uniref:CCHC-type domain-containing protein n=1 Tax=Corynascus novoguineensis TaxID=1126955 RepID=A0AAN7D1T1_9PEZI|nr:hypothetical protein C7999DRAFT_37093 [Corynascus novoguineensis]